MLSKSTIKLIRSLKDKKQRYNEKLFVAEGHKTVFELLDSKISLVSIFASDEWANKNKRHLLNVEKLEIISDKELEQISSLKSTREVIALATMPQHKLIVDEIKGKITIALDRIQDPGNLGTIIRIADWYGIENIICSQGSADCYNSKTIQSSMGSIARVKVHYAELQGVFNNVEIPIVATTLEGEDFRKSNIQKPFILLIGNEGAGIDAELFKYVNKQISIPKLGKAESLNAAVACGILVDFFSVTDY